MENLETIEDTIPFGPMEMANGMALGADCKPKAINWYAVATITICVGVGVIVFIYIKERRRRESQNLQTFN